MQQQPWYILGASGFLGGQFAAYLASRGMPVITARVDITDLEALRAAFVKHRPAVVVNFAGVRAYPNIDWCETHKSQTALVNVAGPINVATAAQEIGAYCIQIASGCIYSGGPEQAFTEDDPPNFFGSFYSRMRIAMQSALEELPVLQARIRMPLSAVPHPRNLLDKIVSYAKVVSVPNSVTVIEDLWPALVQLADQKPVGILNLTNGGYVTHQQLLEAYRRIVDPSHTYEAITVDQLHTITAAQRSNCVLSGEKAAALGIVLPEFTPTKLQELMESYHRAAVAA